MDSQTSKSVVIDSTLSSSYGGLKKSKMDVGSSQGSTDGTQRVGSESDWVKKSWNKKKEKKMSIHDFDKIK